VHLDVRDSGDGFDFALDITSPTLVIAGDVAPFVHPKYRDYMRMLTKNHGNVAYVPGNHEYYGSTVSVEGANDYMERTCRSLDTNVRFLRANGDTLRVPGTDVCILGATGWTDLDPSVSHIYKDLLNDFKSIRVSPDRFISPRDMTVLHGIDRKWIGEMSKRCCDMGLRPVVVTHHSPDRRLSIHNDKRVVGGYGPLYYASDMEPLYRMPCIRVWCYGHTHESSVMRLPGTETVFVTNALGYPTEHTGFARGAGLNLMLR
jgi:hypothetical protein